MLLVPHDEKLFERCREVNYTHGNFEVELAFEHYITCGITRGVLGEIFEEILARDNII